MKFKVCKDAFVILNWRSKKKRPNVSEDSGKFSPFFSSFWLTLKIFFFFLNETELCKDDFLFLHCKIKQINKTEIESLQRCFSYLKLAK